jgi:chromosome segregation ATPase
MTLFGKRQTEEIRAAKAVLEAENEELKRVRSSLEAEVQRLQQELAELKRGQLEEKEETLPEQEQGDVEEALLALQEENRKLKEKLVHLQEEMEARKRGLFEPGTVDQEELVGLLQAHLRKLQEMQEQTLSGIGKSLDQAWRRLEETLSRLDEHLKLQKKQTEGPEGGSVQEKPEWVCGLEERLQELAEVYRRLEGQRPAASARGVEEWFSWGGKWWRKSQILFFTEYQSQVTSINGEAVRSGLSTEALLGALCQNPTGSEPTASP